MGLFGKTRFAFDEARNLGVFVCRHVTDGAPILHVSHDGDGDWQFLCGADHSGEGEKAEIRCLEHVVHDDPSLNQIANLCCNGEAFREREGGPWKVVDRMEDDIRNNIKEYGWHVMNVGAGEGEPAFSYSIGMEETLGHPEIIMFGLKPDLMHAVINHAGDRIKDGETLAPDTRIAGLLGSADCILCEVDKRRYADYFGYARWYYQGDTFRALQCFWPGRQTPLFPWEDGADEYVVSMQPDLRKR